MMRKYKKEIVAVILLVIMFLVCSMSYTYAMSAPVSKVIVTSENASYENSEEGSWQVEKSAKWISKGKARVTFDVDTTLMSQKEASDIIFVIDTSASMEGDKINQVKVEGTSFINDVLSNSNNRLSIISFNSTATILSDFTNDKEVLINQINSLGVANSTNYYQAFLKVDELLQSYQQQNDRETVVMFLTDGYPYEGNPNQIIQYQYLKEAYPYLIFNAIQYEMGNVVIDEIKEVSDFQFIASVDNLGEILSEASITPVPYEEFQIVDYINNDYFTLNSVDDIKVSDGKVELAEEDGVQKISWTIDNYLSGRKIKLTMDLSLKDEYIGQGGVYSTNISEKIISKIGNQNEEVTSTLTPMLAESYQVIYDGNAPEGATVSNVPSSQSQFVFDTIEITEEEPSCSGYLFQGWEIVTEDVKKIGNDYFVMPEENVILRAKWSKIELAKSMDGVVSQQGDPIMKGYTINSTEDFNSSEYKPNITSIVTKSNTDVPDTAVEVWDVSLAGDWSVVGYVEDDGSGNGTYQLTLGGRGGIILSNANYLFRGFSNLVSLDLTHLDTSRCTTMYAMFQFSSKIESLDLSSFDTSNVTDMALIFSYCSALRSINLSSFDTKNVSSMMNMFASCPNLVELDVSNFNMGNVTIMSGMFQGCSSLRELDLSSFDTSSVSVMSNVFTGCRSLVNLNISNFNTSNVTNMSSMFSQCANLINLDITSFDTSKVTNMVNMFYQCSGLSSLDFSRFQTSRVTNMSYMFYGCSSLENLDLTSFNTSNVKNMSWMFTGCSNLISLNVSSFDTSKVTDMTRLFSQCFKLESLDVSRFNTSNVTNMDSMFNQCSSLTELNLSSFDTSKVENMTNMFWNCNKLVNLDFRNAEFIATSYNNMFYNINSSIQVIVKDEVAKSWIEDKLSGRGEVIVA